MAVATLRRPLHERFLSVILTAISLLFVALPAGIWWHMHTAPRDVAGRHSIAIPPLNASELAAYHRVAAAPAPAVPVVLAYHDVRDGADPHRDPYTVTPEQFASQMAMLKEAGFRTITARQLQDWINGGDLPPHAVAITFDDGPTGLWRYADSVLERLDMHAIAFVVTDFVGRHRPYYLSWNELDRMQASGRWDIESHTRNGHGLVRTGQRAKDRGPFLINRMWLPAKHRLETIDEYERRVRRDLEGSVADVQAHDLPRPHLFAFPFSAETSPTNDPRAPAFVSTVVKRLFTAAVSNVEPGSWVSQRDRGRGVLPRVEVFGGMKPREVFDRMRLAAPLGARTRHPLEMPEFWVDTAGQPFDPKAPRGATTPVSDHASEVQMSGAQMTMHPRSSDWLGAFFAPGQLADWGSYTLSARASGLRAGASAGVLAHVGDPKGVITVTVSTGYVSVRAGNGGNEYEIGTAHLTQSDAHAVSIKINGSSVAVTVDGMQVASTQSLPTTSSGGIGLSANGNSASSVIQFTDVVLQPATTAATRS